VAAGLGRAKLEQAMAGATREAGKQTPGDGVVKRRPAVIGVEAQVSMRREDGNKRSRHALR
jgi:hypothetical protein